MRLSVLGGQRSLMTKPYSHREGANWGEGQAPFTDVLSKSEKGWGLPRGVEVGQNKVSQLGRMIRCCLEWS